jgi:hypothetical protein
MAELQAVLGFGSRCQIATILGVWKKNLSATIHLRKGLQKNSCNRFPNTSNMICERRKNRRSFKGEVL